MVGSGHAQAAEAAPRPHAARQAHRRHCYGRAPERLSQAGTRDIGHGGAAEGRDQGREGESQETRGEEAAGYCEEGSFGEVAAPNDLGLLLDKYRVLLFHKCGTKMILDYFKRRCIH